LSLLYCHYCSVMHVTVMPVSAYMALAFVFGFIPNKLMMMMMKHTPKNSNCLSKHTQKLIAKRTLTKIT